MEESILLSIKKLLGIDRNYSAFDQDIVMHINSTISILSQIGVGFNRSPLIITGEEEKWSDLLGYIDCLELVKTYIYMRVRMMFDPPTSSAVMESLKSTINELEWRISVQVDPPPKLCCDDKEERE